MASKKSIAAQKRNAPAAKVTFIEPMECLPVTKLPQGPEWTYEIKLDGFRLEAVKSAGTTTLYSRRRNVLNRQFTSIAQSLKDLPDSTVLDGEVVALDSAGRSSFTLLQNFRSAEAQIHYYAFDVLLYRGKTLMQRPLNERRAILNGIVPRHEHISLSVVEQGSSSQILKFVKQHGLEGVIAKRSDSIYEPGKRTGLWTKTRIDLGQEFVIGGYTPGIDGFDSLIVGFYRERDLMFAARVRAGFVPATRRKVFEKIKQLKTTRCPFVNLPEIGEGRWGAGFTAEAMKGCVWLKPEAVARIDFQEWTDADRLRNTKFVALRDDKDPRQVVKEVSR